MSLAFLYHSFSAGVGAGLDLEVGVEAVADHDLVAAGEVEAGVRVAAKVGQGHHGQGQNQGQSHQNRTRMIEHSEDRVLNACLHFSFQIHILLAGLNSGSMNILNKEANSKAQITVAVLDVCLCF